MKQVLVLKGLKVLRGLSDSVSAGTVSLESVEDELPALSVEFTGVVSCLHGEQWDGQSLDQLRRRPG
jgi:hypothetical protein